MAPRREGRGGRIAAALLVLGIGLAVALTAVGSFDAESPRRSGALRRKVRLAPAAGTLPSGVAAFPEAGDADAPAALEPARVRVVVLAADGRSPVPRATVRIADPVGVASAETDVDGVAAFDGLQAGLAVLEARDEERGPARRQVVLVHGDNADEPIWLTEAAIRREVLVRDFHDGHAIAGALVQPEELHAPAVATGPDGRAGFLATTGSLRASAVGYLPSTRYEESFPVRRRGFVEILLHRAGVLEGRVVDASGRPVQGAQVDRSAADRAGRSRSMPAGHRCGHEHDFCACFLRSRDGLDPHWSRHGERIPVAVVTDERGRFRLTEGVVAGYAYEIVAATADEFRVDVPGPVRGSLVATAGAVSPGGLEIRIGTVAPVRDVEEPPPEEQETATAPAGDGTALDAAAAAVGKSSDGGTPPVERSAPTASRRISVRVRDRAGRPVEGALVCELTARWKDHAVTDSEGRLGPAEFADRVVVRAGGFVPWTEPEGSGATHLDVTLERGAVLLLRLVKADGAAAASAAVGYRANGANGGTCDPLVEADEGGCAALRVPAGEGEIVVWDDAPCGYFDCRPAAVVPCRVEEGTDAVKEIALPR
jgi:protocatechuate 3,4-dioxygenase beta subunit